jgi:large subunit ribosomal protein L20
MVRVKRGNVAKKRRKKILFLAKGFRGSHSKLFRIAHGQVLKALRYSYVGRKKKKAKLRQLWIMRINIMTREFCSLKYSNFISNLRIANIKLNRKMLAQLSIIDSITFLGLQKQFLRS